MSLFYAAGFPLSVTVVVVDIVSPPGSPELHAKDGNLWKRAARYLGWLMPYTMGLYTALAFAKTEPQIVKSGVILVVSKIPAKLITRYGVHAMNHREMVIRATFANLHSALVFWFSADRKEATFIFFACSRMFFSCAATALIMKK